jgi:hypothetical protein
MRMELLVYGFPPGGDYSGRLVGALQRIESGGAVRIVDAVFVVSDEGTGEISAVALDGRRMDAMVAALLEFRLEPAKRARLTERALGIPVVRSIADQLEAGAAVAAVLVEHVWAESLEDAVTRTGGRQLVGSAVEAASLADVSGDLVAAAGGLRAEQA